MPERFMCGVWVALEDIGHDQGPLMYYPGSHKLPIYVNEHIGTGGQLSQAAYDSMWEEVVDVLGLETEEFHSRKGQALIWAANLLHGGMRHKNLRKPVGHK